jgi:hypothetical protein
MFENQTAERCDLYHAAAYTASLIKLQRRLLSGVGCDRAEIRL